MSSPALNRSRILALALVMLVPPIAIVAAIPWLRQQPEGLGVLLTGIAATLTVVSSIALAVLKDRQIDEWQRSNARFSSQWGWMVGAGMVALLLAVPAVRDLIVSSASVWGGVPNPDARLVVTTFTFGFMAVVVTQAICTMLLSLGWHVLMSRGSREPS
ncbi:hypothetical protein [uncultured Brevundimonas sp.]|uniref:hypothetical protein n=1 Tax=uncultured Brevundimonas sp. TaxID=213418 RepID=UPI0030EF2B9C|tara:strand:+ start:415 stop:891 length:477 start_codon:yes stop_codon:yes gene_type:complete